MKIIVWKDIWSYVFDASLKQVYNGIVASQLLAENATTSQYVKVLADIEAGRNDDEAKRAQELAKVKIAEM